jgi:hypothetical protein
MIKISNIIARNIAIVHICIKSHFSEIKSKEWYEVEIDEEGNVDDWIQQ